MKTILLTLASIGTFAAEIENLGTVTPRTGIVLESYTSRSDFMHFMAEFFPVTPPTNKVEMVITNGFLTLTNLAALPSGKTLLGLKSVCKDGTESAVKLYSFEIWRAAPPAPGAHIIQILTGPEKDENTVAKELEEIGRKRRALPPPPIPGQKASTNAPEPLPMAKGETYEVGLDRMAEHYKSIGKRGE